MHPFCRSTTIADFGGETLKGLQRRARDKDGKTMKVPADMTYQEWKKTLDKSAESDIIKSSRISYYDADFGNGLRTSKLDVGSNRFDDISRSQLKQFEADIAYNDYEMAAVFNSTGQEIFRHAGTADAIKFSAEELNNIPVGAIVTHNHPNGSLPSPEDITFLLNRDISEIRACNKQGAYVIRKGSSWDGKGYSLNDVMREYWQINNDVGIEYRDIAAKEGKNIFEYLLEVDEKALDRFYNNHGLELSWEEA